uniref:Putative secreted protein n=1 Tax=Anopheles darlingi TaxID=43151 RepID=A0A2M4D6N4_ANODA
MLPPDGASCARSPRHVLMLLLLLELALSIRLRGLLCRHSMIYVFLCTTQHTRAIHGPRAHSCGAPCSDDRRPFSSEKQALRVSATET